jgi:hypothetical protein
MKLGYPCLSLLKRGGASFFYNIKCCPYEKKLPLRKITLQKNVIVLY